MPDAIDLLFRNNILHYEQIKEQLEIPDLQYLNNIIDYIGQGIKNNDNSIKNIFDDTGNSIYKEMFKSQYEHYCFYKDQYSFLQPTYHPKRYEPGQTMSIFNYYFDKNKDDIYQFTASAVKNYQTFLMLSKLRAWSILKVKNLNNIEDNLEKLSIDLLNEKLRYIAKLLYKARQKTDDKDNKIIVFNEGFFNLEVPTISVIKF